MDRFYSMEQACEKLGTTEMVLRDLVAEGKLRKFRDGAKLMFVVKEVEELAETMVGGKVDLERIDDFEPVDNSFWHLNEESIEKQEARRQAELKARRPEPVRVQTVYLAHMPASGSSRDEHLSLWKKYWIAFRKDKFWAVCVFGIAVLGLLLGVVLVAFYLLGRP